MEGQCHQHLAPGRGWRRRLFCWDHKVGDRARDRVWDRVCPGRNIGGQTRSCATPHHTAPRTTSRQRQHDIAGARDPLLRPPSPPSLPPFAGVGKTSIIIRYVQVRRMPAPYMTPCAHPAVAMGCTELLPYEAACATFAGHVQRRGALHDRRELLHAQDVGACSVTDASVLPAKTARRC